MSEPILTVGICTYNRADNLSELISALRRETCPVPFELLVVDNNSRDHTQEILKGLANEPGVPLRTVVERQQGICHARNRVIAESLHSTYLVFIDDDELPVTGFLAAACAGLQGAACVGGRILVELPGGRRPRWLEDNLLGFLGEVDMGPESFAIKDASTPLWTGNIAYRMELFRDDPQLRFDLRYSRKGLGVGGGEDALMFRQLLARGVLIRYCPDMAVRHLVESWRVRRGYFLRLHFSTGYKTGRWETESYARSLFGVPYFRVTQFLYQLWHTVTLWSLNANGRVRQAMNASHALGVILGCHEAWRDGRQKRESAGIPWL